MAASMASSDFEGWLSEKLEKLNMDNEVFGNYIVGIMEEEDSTEEDKTEALTDILGEISGSVEDVCKEIFQHWNETSEEKIQQQNHDKLQNKVDSDAKIASIMELHATTQEVKKELTAEEEAEEKERAERKAAVIASYGEVADSDEESEDEDDEDYRSSKSSKKNHKNDLMAPNMNAANVTKAVQEQRDKNKEEHAKRREMEKVLREGQLKKADDRKDKEKQRTQKGEKRR